MKVLVVDNNIDQDCWGASEFRQYMGLRRDTTFVTRRAPHQDLPPSPTGFDRVVVTGSKARLSDRAPWIDQLEAFLKAILDRKIPILGICYGHQLLARIMGGDAGESPTPEIGSTKIVRTQENGNSFLSALPETFYSYSMHYDEVRSLPQNAICLASSDRCKIQAFQATSLPVYGTQFHPEKGEDLEVGREIFKAFLGRESHG